MPDLAAMATAAELEQSIRNHRHSMAMGAAQLREHYGRNWEEPEDVAISWNSPTTVNHGGGLGQLVGGVLVGGLGSLGVAAARGLFAPFEPTGPAAPPQPVEWDVTIESVNGKPTATKVEVVK